MLSYLVLNFYLAELIVMLMDDNTVNDDNTFILLSVAVKSTSGFSLVARLDILVGMFSYFVSFILAISFLTFIVS